MKGMWDTEGMSGIEERSAKSPLSNKVLNAAKCLYEELIVPTGMALYGAEASPHGAR